MRKKTVLIVYPHFFPGFKAGGPIQSCVNMIDALSDQYEFKVITSAYDLNDEYPYSNIKMGEWNLVRIGEIPVLVWYHPTLRISIAAMRSLLIHASADVIFVNGLFTMWFLLPLTLFRLKLIAPSRMIVSPRGMLQAGALKSSSIKKKIYLSLIHKLGMFKGLIWHATTPDEREDIIAKFGENEVVVANNIPKKPLPTVQIPAKIVGELKLVYLSLIAEKKNLLLLLKSLNSLKDKVSLDIYGPIKDEEYWKRCLAVMERLPFNIHARYKGEVSPDLVQSTLMQYHAFISLTKGENFGHALFESLSVGRPLVTSYFTPWNSLIESKAGWNVDISSIDAISLTLEQLAKADQRVWDEVCLGAWSLSKAYFLRSSFQNQYRELFGA